MFLDVVGDLLPSALGVAISPVPIIAIVMMLGTPRARIQGPAFAIGWVVGLTVVSAFVTTVAGGDRPVDEPSAVVGWMKLLFGLLFLVLAARQWTTRPTAGEQADVPSWMAALDTLSTGRSALIGAGLSAVNPKNLALTLAASATIGQANLSSGSAVGAVAIFVVVGSLTVVGPVVMYLVAPLRSAGALESIKTFLSVHNQAIMMVVLLLLGLKLIGSGLAAI